LRPGLLDVQFRAKEEIRHERAQVKGTGLNRVKTTTGSSQIQGGKHIASILWNEFRWRDFRLENWSEPAWKMLWISLVGRWEKGQVHGSSEERQEETFYGKDVGSAWSW